jgi:hypothetical protein
MVCCWPAAGGLVRQETVYIDPSSVIYSMAIGVVQKYHHTGIPAGKEHGKAKSTPELLPTHISVKAQRHSGSSAWSVDFQLSYCAEKPRMAVCGRAGFLGVTSPVC